MLDFEALKERLKTEEGVRLIPYRDSRGFWTAGVGHNLEAHCSRPELTEIIRKKSITQNQAEQWLEDDIHDALTSCRECFDFFEGLSDNRQSVLVDFMFNLGRAKVCAFHRMIESLQDEDYATAATEMLNSRWAEQVGVRAIKLAQMMRDG